MIVRTPFYSENIMKIFTKIETPTDIITPTDQFDFLCKTIYQENAIIPILFALIPVDYSNYMPSGSVYDMLVGTAAEWDSISISVKIYLQHCQEGTQILTKDFSFFQRNVMLSMSDLPDLQPDSPTLPSEWEKYPALMELLDQRERLIIGKLRDDIQHCGSSHLLKIEIWTEWFMKE